MVKYDMSYFYNWSCFPSATSSSYISSSKMSPACEVRIRVVRGLIMFLLVLATSKSNSSVARPEEVKVGGVLDVGSYQGKQCKVAIDLAVHDVTNNHFMFDGNRLRIQLQHTQVRGGNVLVNTANVLNLFRGNVVSVVALMSPEVSDFVSLVADSAQVPLITIAGNDHSMCMKHSTYSIQMIGNDPAQMKAIACLLNHFYWREIVVIFEDDELGVSGILALNNALREASARIVQKFAVSQSFNESSLKQILKNLEDERTRSRVFLVHTSYGLAQKICLEANKLGIMKNQGYVWIVTEWVASSLDVTDYKTMDSMKGVVGVRRNIPEAPGFNDISSRWKDQFMKLYPNVTHSEKIDIVGVHCYDSIWIIARAIDDLFRENKLSELEFKSSGKYVTDVPVFQGGKALFQKAAESSFKGISGNIAFDNNGLLKVDSYDIVNVVDGEIRVVGLWNKGKLNLVKERIIWPNGSSIPPSGYRRLLVGVPPHVVFAEFVNISDDKTKFSGFCIEMFQRAVGKLPYHLEYDFQLSEDSDENPDYNDLVEQVVNKTLDAIVADITILANRSARVDFTQPYTDSGLVIMVPIKNTKSSGWAFLQPFTISMWLTAAAFIVLTAFLVWLLERDKNEAFTGKVVKQMETLLWFSFSTIVFAHKEKVMTSLGKFILMIWLFVVLIINSSYTASLTSILTVQQLSPTIRDIETLRSSNVRIGHLAGSFVESYLMNEVKIEESRLVPLVKPEDYVDLLRNGSIGAIVDETPYIYKVMSNHCEEFAIVGQRFYRGGFGFLFAKGSPVLPEMTSAVLNLTQNRTQLLDIRNRWFGPQGSSSSSSLCEDSSSSAGLDSGQLNPRSFWGLFVIITSAYCLLVSAYFALKFYKSRRISTRVANVQSIPPGTPSAVLQSEVQPSYSNQNANLSAFSLSLAVALPPQATSPLPGDFNMHQRTRRRAYSA